MSTLTAGWFGLNETAFRRWGRLVLYAALGFGLLLVVLLMRVAPSVLYFFPLLLMGGFVVWFTAQRPLLHLCLLLVGFVAIADTEPGFQAREVLYGLYLYGYLAYWVVTRVVFYRERLLDTAEAKMLMLFLVLVAAMVPVSLLFGAELRSVFSEGMALVMLALYFPVREAVVRYRHGALAILTVVVIVALLVALRNVLSLRSLLSEATQAWQVATGRVASNDNLMMVGSIFGLTLLVFVRRWWVFALALGVFLVVFGGLIVTQSRGYWAAFLLGSGAMFLLVRRQDRVRMVGLGVLGVVLLGGFSFIFFREYIELMLFGLIKRFSSVQTAATNDLSLVNRFRETQAVWEHIVQNPILGHGMGVGYHFFDLTRQTTDTDSFVHNAYAGLWYKFGLWGLGLMLFVWVRSIVRGVQAFRWWDGAFWPRIAGLAAAITLIAFLLSAMTSNPFFLKDTLFTFGVLMGLTGGAYERLRRTAALRPAL